MRPLDIRANSMLLKEGSTVEPIQDWEAQGVTNLVGGFWRNVRIALHPDHWTPRTYYEYELTLAWVMGESPVDYPDAPTFEQWCSIGGIELDPESWRNILLSGVVPDDGLPVRDQ